MPSSTKIPKAKSESEERFAIAWRVIGGPPCEREYEFAPPRKWRFDFCWPGALLAVEIEGGTGKFKRGRHMRPEGFAEDCAKYNEAAFIGYRVIRLTPPMIQPLLLERLAYAIRMSGRG